MSNTSNNDKKLNLKSVLLNYPNILGYIRLLTLITGSLLYTKHPFIFSFLYTLNITADYFDGILARKYDMCTNFGAILDSYTDCLSNIIITYFIFFDSNHSIRYIIFFFVLCDISHKHYQYIISYQKDLYWKKYKCRFWICRLYYTNSLALDIIYGCQHLFLVLNILIIHGMFYTKLWFFILYWMVFSGFFLNGVIRFLAVIDGLMFVAEKESKNEIKY